MAELDVQPKRKSSNSFLPWLLLVLGVIALVFFLTRNGDRDDDEVRSVAEGTTTYTTTSENAARGSWDAIDFQNAPRASYDEIKSGDVEVNGDANYSIYTMDEDDLFDDGKSNLKSGADKSLTEVLQSINTRFSNGEVRLYGHSHTQGDKENEVSTARMETLKNWLAGKGIQNVSIHPMNDQGNAKQTMKDDEGEIRIVAMSTK